MKEIDLELGSTFEEADFEVEPIVTSNVDVIDVDEVVDVIEESEVKEDIKKVINASAKEVDSENFEGFGDDYEEYKKVVKETGLTEQIEENLGDFDIGGADEVYRQIEHDKMIDEEAEIRADEKAELRINQTLRSATEVLNEQNRLATREAEVSIKERQYNLEKKIKKNKMRELRGKLGSAIFVAIMLIGLYICYINPTLNQGIRTVVSQTLGMFSDLIAGEDVDSNEVIDSIGTTLNNNNMKYKYVEVNEDDLVDETDDEMGETEYE